MADNRHFTDALQNEGGSPVYLEDKKLAERTPVSGAASIANLKFLLVNDDTEGFNTAIKAYIDEAIRSALGALVNNLDKGTAISRILATDGNNDLGTITPANLSSVLGVDIKKRGRISGQNLPSESGIWTVGGNAYRGLSEWSTFFLLDSQNGLGIDWETGNFKKLTPRSGEQFVDI